MELKKMIVVLMILSSLGAAANDKYFDKLKKLTNLQKNEHLVIIYQNLGNCIKCYIKPMEQIRDLVKEGKIKKYKLLAMVRCDRDIELNIYKKQADWNDFLYRDDGFARKTFGVDENTSIIVLDYFGKILIKY
jgi:hypothetical protein